MKTFTLVRHIILAKMWHDVWVNFFHEHTYTGENLMLAKNIKSSLSNMFSRTGENTPDGNLILAKNWQKVLVILKHSNWRESLSLKEMQPRIWVIFHEHYHIGGKPFHCIEFDKNFGLSFFMNKLSLERNIILAKNVARSSGNIFSWKY